MIASLLRPEVQAYIREHEADDEKKLILQQRPIFGVSPVAIAQQIIGRRKAKIKLPLYYNTLNILFPPGLNLEQSSSEKTAAFKARVLSSVIGPDAVIADLTGGFGVDSLFFSRAFKKVIYAEPNPSLLEIARHNHRVFSADNIEFRQTTAEDFLKAPGKNVDCIFLDPSRRDKSNKKVFMLTDCEPPVPALLSDLFQKTDCLFIKTSPLLDIANGLKELKHVETVWIVSVDNECKELLFFCRKGFPGEATLHAINLSGQEEGFSFTLEEEKKIVSDFSKPLTYLYEPNVSILKAGAFKLVGKKFSLKKLAPNTHLYSSHLLVKIFPGRIFKIGQPVKPDPKNIKENFPGGKANIIIRNYPLTPEQLKKKTKLKEGGDHYLIGFSGPSEKYLMAAERIK
ncbi:MAG: SAM-dependent methyltransferase [Cyclobacteriaceae bacterium]